MMPEPTKRSLRNLTGRDIWRLVKTGLTAQFACFLLFGLPYLLFWGAALGARQTLGEEVTEWSGLALLAIMAVFIVWNLGELFENLGRFLLEMGQSLRRASFARRMVMSVLVITYFSLWRRFPTVAFLFSIFVLIPGGFVFDEYKRLR